MGVSHSRSEEFAVDRQNNHSKIPKSASMKTDSSSSNNHHLSVKPYAEKPRSVSSNDVISENTRNNNDGCTSASSSNSLTSSFRSKISRLRKPGSGLSRNTSTTGSTRSNASSTTTVVSSFMTNMNPRTNSTNLVLPLLDDSSAAMSDLRRPGQQQQQQHQFRRGQQTRAILQIPSPVPSMSEPSEDNVSMETISENDTKGSGGQAATAAPLRHVDSPSHNSNTSRIVSGYVTTAPSAAAGGDSTVPAAAARLASESVSAIKSDLVQRLLEPLPSSSSSSSSSKTSYGFQYTTRTTTGIRANAAPFRGAQSINDDGALLGTASNKLTEANRGQQLASLEPSAGENLEENQTVVLVAVATSYEDVGGAGADDETLGVKRRPDTLLASKSLPTYPSWKLQRHKATTEAPLAESESFIVENSPAVEFPPYSTSVMTTMAKLEQNNNQQCTETGIVGGTMNNNVRSTKSFSLGGSHIPTPATGSTLAKSGTGAAPSATARFQSRLKNPSAYEQRQRFIYGRYASVKNESKPGVGPITETRTVTTTTNLPPSKLPTIASGVATKPASLPRELQDSGVKADPGSGSAASSGSDTNGSKAASPEGSLHRGLIDDEIRDQPELTFGRSDGSMAEQQSQITTIQEEIPQIDCAGPVRLRDRARKRSSTTGIGNRMIESYDSTVSSLSIDSEDLMIDYESMDLPEGEEAGDLVASTGAVLENVSIHSSSLGRRSSAVSRGSVSGAAGTQGSWGRKKSGSLASGGKRASLEAVMGELTSLKNETEKGSTQSQQQQQQRQRALSDFPSPSSSGTVGAGQQQPSPSHYNRILRPPLSLECAGLSAVSLDQQTYRHVVQDVTVMKTLLLRLKRALQETETTNPFESSLNLKNGVSKSALLEMDVPKDDERLMNLTKDDLKEENGALRTQIAVMRQQLEEQNRLIQCLQHQLKLCRQRSFRKAESVGEPSLAKDPEDRKDRATTTESNNANGSVGGPVSTDI